MTNELIIEIEGYGNIVVHEDTTLYDLIKRLNKTDDIIACSINNEIVELSYKLKEDTKLKLISIKDRMGAKIYRSGLKFIYITAIKELFGINTDVKLLHSLDKGIYTRIDLDLTVDIVKDIKAKMEELVSRDLRFEKITTSRKEAIKYFNEVKEKLAPETPITEEKHIADEMYLRNVGAYNEEPAFPEYEPIVNERHEDYPSDYDYQEQSPEQLLRQENTRKVFNMAKNSETEKALKMNESSSASDIKIKEKPEKNNLKIKINNDEVILRKGAEIIFKHDGESYSSKVYGIRGNDISVKYRGKKITINSKDIKKIY